MLEGKLLAPIGARGIARIFKPKNGLKRKKAIHNVSFQQFFGGRKRRPISSPNTEDVARMKSQSSDKSLPSNTSTKANIAPYAKNIAKARTIKLK